MEAGGGRLTTILNRSTLTVKSDVMAEWDGVRRTVDFRANIAGEWGDVSGQDEGFDIEGRASSSDTWTRIEIVEGWDYSATGYMSGGTVTDAAGTLRHLLRMGDGLISVWRFLTATHKLGFVIVSPTLATILTSMI